MSLYDSRMPSLKDKHQAQAEVIVEVPEEISKEVEPEEKVKKGRKLNK
jgi:hypothetical protein